MDIGFLGIRRDQLRPGMDIPDAAYTSTTLDKGQVFGGELFEVRIPKGTPGAWLNRRRPGVNNPGEREFLLSREVDRMRVVEVLPDRVRHEAGLQEGVAIGGGRRAGLHPRTGPGAGPPAVHLHGRGPRHPRHVLGSAAT